MVHGTGFKYFMGVIILKVTVNDVTIELIKGDITKQDDFDAVVNAANAELKIGGGVAGAIHRAAGPELYKECKPLAPITVGEAVITGAYNLPNKYVIHTLGPVYGADKNPAENLARSYENSIMTAEENNIGSIAFPSISTGAFGYPVEEAAGIALKTILNIVPELKSVKQIRFVLWSDKDLQIYQDKLAKLTEN